MGQESSQMDKEAECNANANNDLKEGIYVKKFLGLNFRLKKKKNSVEGCIKNPAQKKHFSLFISLCALKFLP